MYPHPPPSSQLRARGGARLAEEQHAVAGGAQLGQRGVQQRQLAARAHELRWVGRRVRRLQAV